MQINEAANMSPDVASSGELYRAYGLGVHSFRQIHRSRSVFACVALSADFVWQVSLLFCLIVLRDSSSLAHVYCFLEVVIFPVLQLPCSQFIPDW